ncbi:DsbA family protein [Neorhizobium sp. NPDC001467]|uniref:DsbA family protein n=1 Tax=Neorhizobium sp. NPDC001467 TaxID=3390595 RepID=UPI003CFFDEE9
MAPTLRTAFSALLGATVLATTALFSVVPAAAEMTEAQKAEMGAFVREYLIANPDVLVEVQQAYEKKQYESRISQAGPAIIDNRDAIFFDKNDIVLGNPNGDVTVVEFFDYNCGYCKHALEDMDTILKDDKNVRFVLKEFPILGPESVAAHQVANAVRLTAPDKYPDFHRKLLGGETRATEETAMAVATGLGLDEAKLRQSMEDQPNDTSVKATYRLANALGITGTPYYVVGNEPLVGAQGADAIEEKIANIRKCGKASC